MNYQELRTLLSTGSGTLTLSRDTLGPSLDAILSTCYRDQPIVISAATPGPGDGEANTVVITGRGNFLDVPDLPLTARFSVDGSGQVRALLKYQMRDEAPGPNAWTFSRSFPKLPAEWNYETGFPTKSDLPVLEPLQKPYLEQLDLLDTHLAVATHAQKDPDAGVPLEPGINLVSKLRSAGMLGALEYAMDDGQPLRLYGPVRPPVATSQTLQLEPLQRTWDRPDSPGIHLRAPLELDFKLGGIAFEQPELRVYSPPSIDWMAQNSSFRPMHGYTGRLSIPSAGITLELSADLEWGLPRALLMAKCSGVTLGKLSQLVDVAGTSDLLSSLPEALRDAVDKLQKLELIELGLDVMVPSSSPVAHGVYITVGMPGLSWQVWDEHLKVESISCRFEVSNPFTPQSSVAVTVMGKIQIEGVAVSVMGRSAGGFSLYAKLDGGETIPLTQLMKTYVPEVPAPSELTINSLAVSIAPGRSYGMSMSLGSQPKPWVVPVGKSNIKIGNVAMELSSSKGASTTGRFTGTASLGQTLTLSVGYSVPGSFTLRGLFPKVNLTQLIAELCDQLIPLPAGFELVLENASLLVQKQGDNYTLLAATSVKDFGLFSFEVRKVAGSKWGFAAGMNMGSAGLSKLPGLGVLKSIEDSFKLQKLMLVVSSFEDAGFTFPDMAQFSQPQLGAGTLTMPAQASGVIQGLMLFAEWQLDENSREQKLLKSLLGLDRVTQSATIAIGADPAKDFRLFVSQKSTIQKQPFQCKFGIQLSAGKPSFFLTGSLTTKIQGQTQTFDVTTAFLPGGAFLSATMKGAASVDCGPFKLSNLALQVGVNWAGIPSLGVAATIDVKDFSSSVAVFFDSTDPSRSLVAGSISSLTAKDVMNAFVGGMQTPIDEVLKSLGIHGTHEFSIPGELADELDELVLDKVSAAFAGAKVSIPSSIQQLAIVPKTRGASWHLTDLTAMRHYELNKKDDKIQVQVAPQFYFAPQPTSIGTIRFPQAFYLNAAISFAGFDAAATIDISPNKGLAVEAQMDKIVILDERLFSISALQGGGGPRISISTFTQQDNPVPEFRPPHVYINGSLTMLGVKKGLYAKVSVAGIDFELVGQLVPGVNFDLAARFGKAGLGADGSVRVGVGTIDLGALGKAKVNTQLEVQVDIDIDSTPSEVSLTSGPSFSGDATLLSNERFKLCFQGDGNLVLYYSTAGGWAPVWASNTSGRGGRMVAFQGDGNLVIYSGSGQPLWASNTNGQGVTRLVLRGDGNLVLCDGAGTVKWSTGTSVSLGGASIELESSFDFAGQHISIGRFKLVAEADTFTKLPEIVSKKVEEALRAVFSDATQWANAVSQGVMDGVNDTSKVFRDVYKKSEKEAKDLSKNVSKGTKAVENVAKDVGKSAEKTTKKVIKKVKFW